MKHAGGTHEIVEAGRGSGLVNANYLIDLHISVSVGMDWYTGNSQETYGEHS